MFGTIVKRELISHLRSLRFSTSFILCFAMMIVSIYLLAEKQAEQVESISAPGWTGGKLSRLTRYGPDLFRRPPTLRVLCTGIGDEMATVAQTPAYDQPQYIQGDFLHDPVPVLFPTIDFVFIVGIVTSLIAIAFTYDLIVGEKQRGTLRLILSNSVPRHYVLSAKWLGSFLSFLIGYVPGLLIVLLYMELHPAILLSRADYISILVIDLLSILYAACFFSLGLFISCRCADSRTSLLILLMLWALLTLIIPSISAYLGSMLRPIPSPYQVEKQVRLIQQEAYSKTLEKISSYEVQQSAIPPHERSERLRAYQNQVVWEEIQSVYRDVSSIRNSYTSKLYEQIQLSQAIPCISPFSSFVYLTSDLCHTGIFSNWHFRRSVEKYQSQFIDYVHERLMSLDNLNEPPNLDTLPTFSYHEKGIAEIIQIHWLHLTLLILYAILFFLAAHISFLRYDVR